MYDDRFTAEWEAHGEAYIARTLAALDRHIAAGRSAVALATAPATTTVAPVAVPAGTTSSPARVRRPPRHAPLRRWMTTPWGRSIWGTALAGAVGFLAVAYNAGAAARTLPTTVTFTNAPLSVVVSELRRRYDVDIRACHVTPGRDRVTITVRDTPLDDLLHQIGRQTELWVHWRFVNVGVRLQPRIEGARGFWYNARMFVLSYTDVGCSP